MPLSSNYFLFLILSSQAIVSALSESSPTVVYDFRSDLVKNDALTDEVAKNSRETACLRLFPYY